MSRKTDKPTPVMPKQCKTCIFRRDGNETMLRPERLGEIQAYLIQGVPHLCHTPQVTGTNEEIACRGGRDYQLHIWSRLGMISAPTDEALAEAMKQVGIKQ